MDGAPPGRLVGRRVAPPRNSSFYPPMEASPATLEQSARPSSRPWRAQRVARLALPWRVWVVDFAPCAALVASMLLAALVIPPLGGPEIYGGFGARVALQEGIGFSALLVLLALLASRGRAVWRGLRGGRAPSPAFEATARTLLRMIPRALAAVFGMVLLRLMMPTFVGFKRAVAFFHPFGGLDRVFLEMDRLLHFGVDPWRLLQPLVGHPGITAALDALYIRWYLVSVSTFLVLIFWLRGASRSRFLCAFAGSWLALGVVLATALSAAGPPFLHLVDSTNTTYEPLLAYLRSVDQTSPLKALELQNTLWQGYLNGSTGLATGIAAMPSMHVALPALFAVAIWHRSRAVSLMYWLYTLLIVVGSVHLGWHYAVDGYVSILLTFPLWWAAGKVTSRWYERTRSWRWGWHRPSRIPRPAVSLAG
jgi:hypothetical protein